MNYKVITPPTSEPITLAEAAMHLRLTPNDDSPPVYDEEALVRLEIAAAREYCERDIMRSLAPQTIEIALNSFPGAIDIAFVFGSSTPLWPSTSVIELPLSPVTSIISIKYIDGDGMEQTMDSADYFLSDYMEPNSVILAFGTSWPSTQTIANAVKVRYRTGYSASDESPNPIPIPIAIKQAMLLLIGHWFENRQAVEIGTGSVSVEIELAVKALLKPYQLRLSMA